MSGPVFIAIDPPWHRGDILQAAVGVVKDGVLHIELLGHDGGVAQHWVGLVVQLANDRQPSAVAVEDGRGAEQARHLLAAAGLRVPVKVMTTTRDRAHRDGAVTAAVEEGRVVVNDRRSYMIRRRDSGWPTIAHLAVALWRLPPPPEYTPPPYIRSH